MNFAGNDDNGPRMFAFWQKVKGKGASILGQLTMLRNRVFLLLTYTILQAYVEKLTCLAEVGALRSVF